MKPFSLASGVAVGASFFSGAIAADPAWQTIPPIEAVGQHFFYSNNGSQFYLKGVAYQENFSPNGTDNNPDVKYTDPLADGASCARDIPFLKQIFTNVIRVYAVDPTADHDDCMQQLAAADIYVVADLSQPGESINSNDPEWNVPLFTRYTSVVDSLSKYNNVIGFFAGNEVISASNQTAAAAFVKAAVRDTKAYIKSVNYRTSLGVGYATADVPGRDQLAAYFACEPDSTTPSGIDFWGYNVYSWCGDSDYTKSSYGERVDFFSDYPVPVFFAEYGCIEGVDGGPDHRPFTEVPVLYGNMTEVFSGGIVYQWFWSDNMYGLVDINNNNVEPKADFTSLSSQLAKISPTITQSSAYKPSNSPPACPSTGTTAGVTWLPQASPLPPNVNPQLCQCEEASFSCAVSTDDADNYGDAFDYICGKNAKYCAGIEHNATTGSYGAISGCDPKVQLGFVANQYYLDQNSNKDACDFNGVASVQGAATASTCSNLIGSAGTDGLGSVASPTGQQGTAAASSSSSVGVPGYNTPGISGFGTALFIAYAITLVVSGVGMIVL
ncbi:glycolipid anchored surface protein [Seiridium cupressi]